MWLLKVPLFILLIDGTKSKKDSQFALEEYYQEVSQIYDRANKIHLEYELASGKIGALGVAERILNKKMDASVLEEYVEMKISGGLKEQNEMLELLERAKESETSDQLKDDVENGFTLMDGFGDLKNELSKFILDFENDLKRLEERLNLNYVFVEDELTDRFDQLFYDNSKFAEKIEPLSHLSEDQALSDDEKKLLSRAIYNLERLIGRQDILDILKLQDLNNDLHNLDSFKQTQVVIEKLNSMMNEVKNLEGLASELPKIEKEIEILEELRDGNEIQEISNRSQNLTKSSDFLKDFQISTNTHGQYESIQSISPLLQKIKSFLSKMKTFLYRTSRSSKKLSTLEKHFEATKIPSGNLAKKFSRLRECINNFDFHLSFKMEINADLDEKLTRIRSLDFDNQEVIKRLKELLEKANNLYQLIASKYTEESQVDRNLLTLFQEFLKGNTWIDDHNPNGFKTHPSNPDKNISIIEYNLLEIRDLVKEMDLDNVRKVFGGTLEKMDEPKKFLECYSNLETTASDTKELLALPGKVWNFDPKVLEGTVEVIGMFKEAYKMVEDIKEWKIASNPKIENFPLNGADVKAVSDGINVLETIRNVQNGWKMMKTLDIGNSGIKESWDLLDSSLSQFFEILSNQKIWGLSNVLFPTNLPIDTISTFIQDEYLENQRNGILNFMREIRKLENDFPEYPNKLYKLNKAMSEMREWEDGKMSPVKKMVDCFEIKCDVSLEIPGSSN